MKNPITTEGAASAQNPLPPVPTTKILAISHFMGTPMTPAQRAQIMPHEVHDTVNAYLGGKIDQWYFRTDGKGVVFIVNASTPEEAKNILEKFPLGQAGLMGFDYIPLGPLSPLRIINDLQPTEEVTDGADQRQSLSRPQTPGAGAGFRGRHAMTSIAGSASEVKVQHRSLLIERGYEEFTGRLEQILGRFVASKLKGLTPDGAMEALKSMEGEQGFMIIDIFDHGADLLMVGQRRKAKQYLIGNPLVAIQITRYDIRAALYAPLRVLVFESEPGRTVVEFDQPSTLFGQFGRNEVTAGAVESDGKLDRVIAKAAMT
jgi:uncharacterized protein (DUF302 family)